MLSSTVTTNPFLTKPAIIEYFPDNLKVVPEGPDEWEDWRLRVRAYRELKRRQIGDDKVQQKIEWNLCARSFTYWLTMYGVIFEPRSIAGNPPAWYPWIPFPFQVKMGDWIDHVMNQTENGRGDGIVEKSRDMGASWMFCAYMVWKWLFAPVFIAGIISRTKEEVDSTNDSDTLFFKIRALAGIYNQVPEAIRLPHWMVPRGMTEEYSTLARLAHPSKTNMIIGEATTALSGVGGRATMRLADEAARFRHFPDAWANQGAVTTHRWAVSSADLVNTGFRELAELGKAGLNNPDADAPSYMRLDWWVHPFHTSEWYKSEKSRYSDLSKFEREYEINYTAGAGGVVYPRFQDVELGKFPYDPTLGELYCTIDPGVSDPTAIAWIQEDTINKRYRVIDSFQGRGTEDAQFYASVLVGVPISGVGGYDYDSYPRLRELMEWTASLNRPVKYFGDPAGNARGGDGKTTFYDAIRDASAELTSRRNVIHVQSLTKDGARTHARRKNALLQLAYRLDFADNAGANAVLTALKESRYPDTKGRKNATAEVNEPVHDEFSHMRTAMEFWAVNMEENQKVKSGVASPVRVFMSGKRR